MKCQFCDKFFKSSNILIAHLNIHHGISGTFTCNYETCSRIFHRRDAYKQHLVTHWNNSSECSSRSSNISEEINSDKIPSFDFCEQVSNNGFGDENSKSPTLNDFCNLLQAVTDKFISSLYNTLTLNRALIQDIIISVSEIFSSGIITIFKNCLSSCSADERIEICKILENPFKNLNTEYKRMQYFENCNCLIRPIPFCIGTVEDPLRKQGQVSLSLKQQFGYFIPMRNQLSSFLGMPGVYEKMSEFREKVLSDKTTGIKYNIMQGDLWQQKLQKFAQKNTFPLVIYFDEFETNNPLGSHAGVYKQGAVYFSIPSFPPEYTSRLENIFLALLFHSEDRVKFGNHSVFQILLDELNFLENWGINISINENTEKLVYFSVAVIIGDNLGLHSLFGLVESFSATYYCRFCKSSKNDMKVTFTENESLVRKVEEYDSFVRNKSYGVKEQCVFHNLTDFHIYRNLTCDIMHDLPEGVHRYSMAFIIKNFISKGFFTLQDLNERIKYFDFGYSEKNIPPPIKEEHLKNGCIIQSAAEMMCLVRNFRFFVGDMIPEDDTVWEYYTLLFEITEIAYSTIISTPLVELFTTLVEECLYLYVTIYKMELKPKFHFLLHYPRVMKQVGPLCNIQSIRFEAKHKELKRNANVVSSRRNISFTLSLRMQLKFCYRLLSKTGLHDTCSMGRPYAIPNNDFKLRKVPSGSYCINWFEKNGITFNNCSVLVIDDTDSPLFCKIVHIIVCEEHVSFLVNMLETVGFNSHLKSYEVEFGGNKCELYDHSFFVNCIPGFFFVASDNKKYITKC